MNFVALSFFRPLSGVSAWAWKATPAGLIFLLAGLAHGQDWQFGFDARGNLLAQTAEVIEPPKILAQPQPQVAGPGQLASFFVVSANTRDLSYQWRFNDTNIDGATTDTLLIRNVSAMHEGKYSVLLVNPSGSVTSAPAALMLDGDRDGLPDAWELASFGNLNQYPTADSDGDGVSNAQEFLDGTNPTNRASALFRLAVTSDGGWVTVTPTRGSYTNGETVTLTASAPFRAWTGDTNTTNNPITLTMTTNRTVFAHASSLDLTWTNRAGGDWDLASNWKPNFVPTANDNAFVTESVRVTNQSPAACRSLVLGGPDAPTLTGSGTLTLHGDSYWVEGTMGGTGRTVVAPGATLHVQNFAPVTLSTRTLENAGTILWSGGNLAMNNATITNRAGGLFLARNPATQSGSGRMDNSGTFRAISPGTTTGVPFNNYGAVEIQSGVLAWHGGGFNGGTIDVQAGATLNLSGGTLTSSATSSIGGAGDFIVSGATATLAGLVNPSGTHLFSGGIAHLNGTYIGTDSSVTISGGTANFNGTGTAAVMNLRGGTLGGSGVLTVLNEMNWAGGTMGGSGRTLIVPEATLNLVNAGPVTIFNRTLENGGTTLWTGTGSLSGNSAVITNRAGALFEARNNASFVYQGGGASRFDNAGLFRKTGPASTTIFDFSFHNHGTAEIQTGTLLCSAVCVNNGAIMLSTDTTLRLEAGGSASGVFTAPGTALVEWMGGTFLLNPGAQLNGAGLYRTSGGTLTFNADAAVDHLDMNAPLNGTGVMTVNNVMNWTRGTMSGNGRTRIAPGATLNINNPLAVTLNARTLENGGTVLWTGTNIGLGNAVITNRPGALFEARNAASLAFSSGVNRFDNAGTFRKAGHTGTTTVASGTFNNYNTVEIKNGILAASGGYTSSGGALLNCAIGGITAGTGFGQLQVAGTVNLNGSLRVDLANAFIPAVNDSFTVLTAGTRNGTFADFQYPLEAVTMQASNTLNSVVVRVTGLVESAPILLPPEIAGSSITLTWTAVSNATYRLEYKTHLGLTGWFALSGDVISRGNTATKLDTLTSSNRFYRVRLVP